jgi:hypothetical protein
MSDNRPSLSERTRRAEEEIAAVDDEQASDHGPVSRAWKMQQEIDAGWHAEKATNQEDPQAAPFDRAPERGNAEDLDRDAANDHHVHRVERAVHQMEQQGAAQRRKSKAGDARDGGRREHGEQRIADAVDTLRGQHGTFGDEKAEANDGDGDHGERARIGGERQGKSCGLNELFWHARTCVARRRQSSHLAAFSFVDLEIAEVTRTTAAAATVVRLLFV